MPHVHVADLEVAQHLACALLQRGDALDAVERDHERRQHRRLVPAARADFEHLARRAPFDQRLGHPRDDLGLRDRLAVPERQRGVLVGAARQGLVDEQVAGDVADAVEDLAVA